MVRRTTALVCSALLIVTIPGRALAEDGDGQTGDGGSGETSTVGGDNGEFETATTVVVVTAEPEAPDAPAAADPVTDDAVADEPATGEPATEEPATDDVTANEPVADEPPPPVVSPPTVATEPTVASEATVATEPTVASEATVATAPSGASAEPEAGPATTAPPSTPQHIEIGDQSVAVSGTATAVAVTGGNVMTSSGTTGDGDSSGTAQIATGGADAIGSADETRVSQEVVTVLSDEASAEIVQVVFVFNIGAAIADSGLNAVLAGAAPAGGGLISTGIATAIGNEATTSIMQAAAGEAGANALDATTQSVVALRIGVSVADTGLNVTASTTTLASGGAGVQTGDARAVGNLSSTDVGQVATAIGSGTSHIDITQWATVLNLGLALASTGGNEIGMALGEAIDQRDPALAEQLIALLLPTLIGPVASPSGGSGAIDSGDATAIGNLSSTVIRQVATATARDDGSVSIDQHAMVANIGAAIANSGGNTIGSTDPTATLASMDDRTRDVVTQLSAALLAFLAQVDAMANGAATGSEPVHLTLTIGDTTIDIGATLAGSQVSAGGDARATLRQVTAVFDIGISRANTGQNVAVSVQDSAEAATPEEAAARFAAATDVASSAVTMRLSTGNATARNVAVLVVCQVDDVDPVVCEPEPDPGPGPNPGGGTTDPTPTIPNPPTVDTPAAQDPPARAALADPHSRPSGRPTPRPVRMLPATGSDPSGMLVLAAGSMLLGLVLIGAGRRSTRP